jgi:hypothetical protein
MARVDASCLMAFAYLSVVLAILPGDCACLSTLAQWRSWEAGQKVLLFISRLVMFLKLGKPSECVSTNQM